MINFILKQKFIDRLNESNKQFYMKTNMKKFFSDNDFNKNYFFKNI